MASETDNSSNSSSSSGSSSVSKSEKKPRKNRKVVECDTCGHEVVGFSDQHIAGNMKIHKSSETHKKLLRLKKKWRKKWEEEQKQKSENGKGR